MVSVKPVSKFDEVQVMAQEQIEVDEAEETGVYRIMVKTVDPPLRASYTEYARVTAADSRAKGMTIGAAQNLSRDGSFVFVQKKVPPRGWSGSSSWGKVTWANSQPGEWEDIATFEGGLETQTVDGEE